MRGAASGGGGRGWDFMSTMQPLSIVLTVVIFGSAFYMWRRRMIRSRAAIIVLAGILLVLIYLGFFSTPGYERYIS